MSAGRKCCSECGKVRGRSEFSRKSESPDGLQPRCKECDARYRAGNKVQIAARHRRVWARKYGIAEAVLLELKQRPCDICGASAGTDGKAHNIDHCHLTGSVRGVLCFQCNTAVGKFNDSPELLTRAIHYLTRGADYRAVDREA